MRSLAAIFIVPACSAVAPSPWETLPPIVDRFDEDFAEGIDTTKWLAWGSPKPAIVEERFGRRHVFDNRGDGTHDSGITSTFFVRAERGFIFESEVFLEVTKPEGCWLAHHMQLTGDANERVNLETGEDVAPPVLEMLFQYEGDACWGTEAEKRRHAWLTMRWAHDQVRILPADDMMNRWVRLTIEVSAAGTVTFLVDGRVACASTGRVDGRALRMQRARICGRSQGSAGRAWVSRVSFRGVEAEVSPRRGDRTAKE